MPYDARVNGPAARTWPGDRVPEEDLADEASESAGDEPISPRPLRSMLFPACW